MISTSLEIVWARLSLAICSPPLEPAAAAISDSNEKTIPALNGACGVALMPTLTGRAASREVRRAIPRMPIEPMELRYGSASTIFCAQFKKSDWHAMPGSGIRANAIMDCIAHSAAWLFMGKEDMCKRMAERGECGGSAGSHSRYLRSWPVIIDGFVAVYCSSESQPNSVRDDSIIWRMMLFPSCLRTSSSSPGFPERCMQLL